MTNYGNLVLLSDGENTPLVIREAMIAGLGVVCSESCTEELEDMPFITVIPDEKRDDLDFVTDAIESNREYALRHRKDIRQYGIDNYGWDVCLKDYVNEIEKALSIQAK
jgi:glycosyltransferase involved in cell wall biosynthesis